MLNLSLNICHTQTASPLILFYVFVACWNYSTVFDISIEGTTEGSVGFLITILWI